MKLYCIGSNLIRRHLLYCVNNFVLYNIEKYIYELILYKYYYIILLYNYIIFII